MAQGGIQQQLSQSSALQKYRYTVTGQQSIKDFLLYEFLTDIFSPLPRQLGVHMRRLVMPFLFAQFGHRVTMYQNIAFRRPSQICIGNNVVLETGITLEVKGDNGFIHICDDVHIGKNTILSCPGGTIMIGKNTTIGESCRLGSLHGLTIGPHSILQDSVCIVGAGHSFSSKNQPIISQPLTCRGETVIGEAVKIGNEATLLDGVKIGKKARILANTLVRDDIAANCTVSGIPASCC